MIRVLEIISDTNIGGGGRSLLNYLEFYDRTRFECAVVLPRNSALKERVEALNVPIFEIDAMADKSMDTKALPLLRQVIREWKPQLVHTHGSLIGRIASRMEHKKTVYTKHCAFPPTGILATAPGRLLNRCVNVALSDGILAIGPSAREILLASGIPDSYIHVLFNGVTPLPEPTREQRVASRAKYGFTDEDFVIGILARVEEYKGHGILLEAFRQLHKEGRRVKLLVAGDGSYLEQLRQSTIDLPRGSVVCTGFIRDVEQVLWAMDVQVNASYESETSSLSLLEGMSLGLPAVVSSCGGNPFLIQDGKNGLVFENRNGEQLARCVARLMDEPERYHAMEQGAREIFRERFTGEVFARNTEAIYQDVLKGV